MLLRAVSCSAHLRATFVEANQVEYDLSLTCTNLRNDGIQSRHGLVIQPASTYQQYVGLQMYCTCTKDTCTCAINSYSGDIILISI